MSLANKISIFRILLVPCIVASLVYYQPSRDGLRYLSLGLFLIGIFSDAVDGFVARSKHQQSQLGIVLDPIADKLLILSVLISLSTIRALPEWMRIPAWFNLIVISRDVLLIVGTLLIFGLTGKIVVKPSWLGKWTIAAQMLVVPTVLLGLPIKMALLVLTAVLTIVSGIGYIRMGTQLLSPG
jgi:CDP-diacylglycerol--glycerol-3-phosphate 3-phosphatidyltransferase/cardiolipin synthase